MDTAILRNRLQVVRQSCNYNACPEKLRKNQEIYIAKSDVVI